jgi:hypothetical protein
MANLGTNFYPKLVQISSELGMKPEDIIAVMTSESGLDPSAHEAKYNGGGLIGFMPATLKGIKYNGSPEDFRKLSGEEQLDWVKKVIQGFMSMNGGPFTSAAQYYVANFFPAALKLPGIRSGNASTAFLEANPEVIEKNGVRYSKKYYDVGIKVSAENESRAYRVNTLFHGSTPNAITLGDMMKQVEKNKRNPIYIKALMAMKNSTGYEAGSKLPSPQKNIEPKQNMPSVKNIDQTLNSFLQMVNASDRSFKKIYKKSLPSNNILIQLDSDDYINNIEFARILSMALDIELFSDNSIHKNGSSVEINCNIYGPKDKCFIVVSELSKSVLEAFKIATTKLNNSPNIKINCIENQKSKYDEITVKMAETNHRQFLLKFMER